MKYTRITLRIPEPLHEKLSRAAEVSSKSMNAEIVGRLQQTFEAEDASATVKAPRIIEGLGAGERDYMAEVGHLEAKLDQILKRLEEK